MRDASAPVYVRFSEGAPDDAHARSVDHETGLELPGLAVNVMDPPSWWRDRPVESWIVRQICTYAHLQDRDDERECWLLTGTIVGHGPDNEPLVRDVWPLAKVSHRAVREAARRRPPPSRREDEAEPSGAAPWQA